MVKGSGASLFESELAPEDHGLAGDVAVYMGDILITGGTQQDHLQNLVVVLER